MSVVSDRCPPGYTDIIYGISPSIGQPTGDYCFAPKGSGLKPVAAKLPFSNAPGTFVQPISPSSYPQTQPTGPFLTGGLEGATEGTPPSEPQVISTNPQLPLPIQPPLEAPMTSYAQPVGSAGIYGPNSAYGTTGVTGVNIGPGGVSVEGTVFGVPVTGTIPIGGGGGSEAPAPTSPSSPNLTAPTTTSSGECPGLLSIKDPITGQCINLDALPPGGNPAMTGPVQQGVQGQQGGYGPAVYGWYGVGLVPRVEVQTVRRCPPGMALGKDGVCYQNLGRNSKKRAHPRGMKPLMTGGDRAAIARAARVARALDRSKKSLKKAGKALEKVC